MALHALAAWRAHTLAIAAAGGAPMFDDELTTRIADAKSDGGARLAAAMLSETARRWGGFWDGVCKYHDHPYRRADALRQTFWRHGNTRLLDIAPDSDGPPVLVTPSLINSSDVLDLLPDKSLVQAIADAGFHPFLVDWGMPEPDAARWTVDRYIAEKLAPMAAVTAEATGDAPIVLGYCMGGLLAAALAAACPNDVRALGLLATPWDFHAPTPETARLVAGMAGPFRAAATNGAVPTDVLQVLFFALDPTLAARKYRRFACMDQASPEAVLFVAMEDWVNGGPDLALPVAETILETWYGENATARGQWRVAGIKVDNRCFDGPMLVAAPSRDRIVPPESARAFAAGADRNRLTVLDVDGGHVGMIVGHDAKRQLWRPLLRWLRQVAT